MLKNFPQSHGSVALWVSSFIHLVLKTDICGLNKTGDSVIAVWVLITGEDHNYRLAMPHSPYVFTTVLSRTWRLWQFVSWRTRFPLFFFQGLSTGPSQLQLISQSPILYFSVVSNIHIYICQIIHGMGSRIKWCCVCICQALSVKTELVGGGNVESTSTISV